jgi:cell fate regulator YaaT (PSP1 superfamily)
VFEHNEPQIPRTPTRVVVKTDKGLELGHLVGHLCSHKDGRFRLSEDQICSYFINSEINFNTEPVGKVVRFATADDISEEQHLQKITEEEIACCEQIAKSLNLRMKIIDAEHIFGGERIVFYFMAEGRVDFRELVRKLAQEYQTRIEMRQVGSRDEAKLLGDVESCGRECCCLQFLQLLKPVNMRMAKMQKATLDPSKISGYCGRLKCCLRYEDETYMHLKQSLPRKGVLVQTKQGEGKVFDTQILTQLVVVEYENGERAAFPLDEITVLPGAGPRRRPPQEESPANDNRQEEPASDRPPEETVNRRRQDETGSRRRQNETGNRRRQDQTGNRRRQDGAANHRRREEPPNRGRQDEAGNPQEKGQ